MKLWQRKRDSALIDKQVEWDTLRLRMKLAYSELLAENDRLRKELKQTADLVAWYEDVFADPPSREQLAAWKTRQ